MTDASKRDPWVPYLGWLFATLIILVASVGTLAVLVDPLGVFGSPRIAGVNAVKPYLDHHRELARWSNARRVCANVGIFGNSRAEIGLDPENPLFARKGLSAFNHAIPGTSAQMTLRQMNWLGATGCMPGTVILGVEFFDFLGGAEQRPLPAIATDPVPFVDSRFLAEAVFSLAGLRDAIATLALQRNSFPATLTSRGFNPLRNYIPEVARSGHYVLFRQRAEENTRNWSKKPRRLKPADGSRSEDEQLLDAILARSEVAGSKVYLVIYPYHAQVRMLIERLGMGALFAQWKRDLVALAAAHAARGAKVEVWDFSGIGPETTEAIPARGDTRTTLKYYWEAGHFKSALGDKLVTRLYGEDNRFGARLDSAGIEEALASDRQAVEALMVRNSTALAEVDDIVARFAAKRKTVESAGQR